VGFLILNICGVFCRSLVGDLTQGEVSLVFNYEPVDLSFYSENGEWNLISATGSTTDTKSRGGTTFSSLEFSIKLQRRPMFHVINTLFPVALMAVLIAMVFKLPVDSGEKIGFALTVLLILTQLRLQYIPRNSL
jgi:hypothetical protein